MVIHTFGDSHSRFGWKHCKNNYQLVIMHHLGPLLAYSFGRDKLNYIDIRNYGVNNGDTLVFCLGEIDCRCHVHKHITDTITYQEIIDNIINNYLEAIELNVLTSNLNFKNICVYNIVPPVNKHNTEENPEYPYIGSDEERKSYVLYFNKKLKEKCSEKNYIFIDIYNNYVDEYGFLRKDLSDGNVHINDGIYITNFMKEHNL